MPVQANHHIFSQERVLRHEKSKPEQADKGEGWVIDSSCGAAPCRGAGNVIWERHRQLESPSPVLGWGS